MGDERMFHLPSFANSEGGVMRSLLTIMLLAAAALPALGQAQTVNICDRTQAVRFAIMRQARSDDCATVSAAQMDGIEELELDGRGIASLTVC